MSHYRNAGDILKECTWTSSSHCHSHEYVIRL